MWKVTSIASAGGGRAVVLAGDRIVRNGELNMAATVDVGKGAVDVSAGPLGHVYVLSRDGIATYQLPTTGGVGEIAAPILATGSALRRAPDGLHVLRGGWWSLVVASDGRFVMGDEAARSATPWMPLGDGRDVFLADAASPSSGLRLSVRGRDGRQMWIGRSVTPFRVLTVLPAPAGGVAVAGLQVGDAGGPAAPVVWILGPGACGLPSGSTARTRRSPAIPGASWCCDALTARVSGSIAFRSLERLRYRPRPRPTSSGHGSPSGSRRASGATGPTSRSRQTAR